MSWSMYSTGKPDLIARELHKIASEINAVADDVYRKCYAPSVSVSISGHFDEYNSSINHTVTVTPEANTAPEAPTADKAAAASS